MKSSDPRTRWALYASHLGSYMRRWILRTPWGTARIHNIQQSDAGRDHHDHPFSFVSLILWGGYVEHRPGCDCRWGFRGELLRMRGPCKRYGPWSIVRRRAGDFHRLELNPGRPAWTFVLTTTYFRGWGFLTRDGWVPYQEYNRSFYKADSHTDS